ncbi:unnamed protein product [Phaedon cochleariae]|uniref:Uncharacterized protein n=1 Tax=Phaedon cochleariae TaxID=80249 RepID=A0A9P0DKW4_PHACE|nr:unnamed protein product [Phaedon cochleariae]
MHRSLTLSEIVSSTLSSNKNDIVVDNEFSRDKFFTNIGIGLIEFFFSSLLLCYGIIFAENVGIGTYNVKGGLWTTILYISTYQIIAPWSKRLVGEWYEVHENRNIIFRCIVFILTCLLILGVMFSGFPVFYGICGGLTHSMVSTQLTFIAMRKFKMDERKIERNLQPAKAISLLILPHVMLVLVDNYTIAQSFLIYAAFLLNIIPASWIIRYNQDSDDLVDYPDMSRYQTLSVLTRQMAEMKEFSKSPQSPLFQTSTSDSSSVEAEEEAIVNENDIPENDTPENDAETPRFIIGADVDDKGDAELNDDGEHLTTIKQLTHQTVDFYYSNMGVNILPGIPEEPEIETEKDSDSSKRNTIDPKRLSRISAALEELNQKDNTEKEVVEKPLLVTTIIVETPVVEVTRKIEELATDLKELNHDRDGGNTTAEEGIIVTDVLVKMPPTDIVENIKSIEYIHDTNSNNRRKPFRDLRDYSKFNCCKCSPYNIYIWKHRFRSTRYFLTHLFQPLYYSLTDLHFYPTLVSKVAILLNSTIFFTLAPHLFLKKNSDYKKEATAFLLSYMAFSWCIFLVFLPLVVTFSKVRMRYTFSIGLLVNAFSMLLLSKRKMSNDLITWFCLLFGFGFGMINFSQNLVYKSFLDQRKPEASQAALDIFSGFAVILAYYFISISELDIVRIFPIVSFYAYVIMAGFWTILSWSKICIKKMKKNILV